MSKTLKISSCPSCKSKNNLKTWEYRENIITKCMTPNCTYTDQPIIEIENLANNKFLEEEIYNYSSVLELKEIPLRGLSLEVCEKLQYYTGIYKKKEIRGIKVFNNWDEHIGWKIKYVEEKKFSWEQGKKPSGCILPGLVQAKDYSSPLVITEGEEDMLSFWEIGYQACTLLEGAESAKKGIEESISRLLKYKEIILCLDTDDAGKKAHTVITEILKNKIKLKHCKLDYKDANEAFLKNKNHLITQIAQAEEIRPKGFKFGEELNFDSLYKKREDGVKIFLPELNKMLKTFNFGMLYLISAGASIGKSTFLRQQFKFMRDQVPELGIATIFIEESEDVAPKCLLAQEIKIPIGDLMLNPSTVSKNMWEEICTKYLKSDRVSFITEDFRADINTILELMEYLSKIHKYKIFIIDHLTAIISSSFLSRHGERRDIDEFMEKLFEFARRTQSIILVACHLTKPGENQKSWDEGRIPTMYDLRGSGSLATKPDGIIGLVRNLKDEKECDKMYTYVLKNRWFHKVGYGEATRYLEDYGLIEPISNTFTEK